MATYNGEKYIQEQLESIFSQENVKVKVLVRDDGSTDQTKSILDKWSNSHDLEWYTGEHLNAAFGFYDLMLHGKDTAYEYFAFSDQDDIWDKDKLFTALQFLEKMSHSKPCLYYCGQRLVDENANYLDTHYLNVKRNMKTKFIFSDIAGCTTVFNKILLNKVVDYKPSYMMMHDTWLIKVCLALGGEIYADREPHISYRQHGHNAVGLSNKLSSKIIRAKTYIFDYDLLAQMQELKKGYQTEIVPEYNMIINYLINYKEYKSTLLNKNHFDFCDFGLNITFKLKVLLGKI